MNVAVTPEHRRRGIALALLEAALRADRRPTAAAATRSRCASRTQARSSSTSELGFRPRGVRRGYYTDNREDALIMWQDPVSEPATQLRDPRARDLLRRDRGGARHRGRRDPLERRLLAGRAARARTAASCPRSRRAGTSSSSSPVVREALAEADATLDDVETRRCHRRARADRRAARRALRREGARLGAAACRSRRSTTCTATSPRSSSSPIRSSRRSSACSRAAATRCCSTCASAARFRRARHDARRRGRRGVRQGRAAARPRLPGRRRDRPARARGRPGGVLLPGRARAGPRLLVLRA